MRRIDRRVVNLADWRLLELELAGLTTTLFETQHIISRILLPGERRSCTLVELLDAVPVEAAP